MHWVVISPWMVSTDPNQWFLQHLPNNSHTFSIVPSPISHNWHQRKTKTTSLKEWIAIWQHVHCAEKVMPQKSGLITLFPQRPAIAGLRHLLYRKHYPIIAWDFNVGKTYDGMKRKLAQKCLHHIDKFVVHSTWEITKYAEWLQIPESRFHFAYYQCPIIPMTEKKEEKDPFILALGSANRDFRTFFHAVEKMGIRTIVVSSDKALESMRIPTNVEIMNHLNHQQCLKLAQKARINVVPIVKTEAASGHVTVVEAMSMKCSLIVTDSPGLHDYVEDRKTALTVPEGDVNCLITAMTEMWEDEQLRRTLEKNALQFATDNFSDPAAARCLQSVLNDVAPP